MKLIYQILLLLIISSTAIAQSTVISGIVKDKNTNRPLPGVTVTEKGTRNASTTNEQGEFTLAPANKSNLIQFSYSGYKSQEVKQESQSMNISLSIATLELDEVVVTALGIQRGRKELGYSVQTIKSKDLTEVRQTNLVNALAGRIAGVNITNGSSGIGSSSRIVIRGENSLSGNNQALFVVDGVPISNNQITNNTENNETGFQEVDYGNGAAELSADDIESITVLKGANAAALYGSRAASGVVVIKTKDGLSNQGRGVTFNSSLTFETPLRLPKYQNTYGAGVGGKFSYEDGFGAGINDGGLNSFGPMMSGQLIKQFNSPSTDINGNPVRAADIFARKGNPITPTPFLPHSDNIRDYFKTGATYINNVAFNGGNDKSSFRISYTNLSNKGMMPNIDLKRNSVALSGFSNVSSKLSARAFVNFIQSASSNRPGLGYGSENPMYTFNWTGRQVDFNDLKDYWQVGRKDFNQFNSNYLWLDNPYFTAYENTNGYDKKRLLGNASLNYAISDNLSLRFRSGTDYYHDLRASKRAFSTKRFINGAYREDEIDYREINSDVLLTYEKELSPSLLMTLSGGGNTLNQKTSYKSTTAGQLSVPGIYNFGNSKIPLVATQELYSKKINSLYAISNFAYKGFLFADITLRNDWSSTLPEENNSYLYYSGSLGLILSDLVQMPSFISYSKLRLSGARVGSDTDPYQLNNTFAFNQNYGSTPLLTNSSRLLNPNLTPEKLTSLEAGLELSFLKDRVGLDATVYQTVSSDQIIKLPTSSASGYTSRLINGGKIRSRGVELTLKATPLSSNNFKWNSFINFSHNQSQVIELPNGVDQYITGFESLYASSDNAIYFIATPKNGGRVGDMYGTGLLEVNGQKVYDAKGFPVRDPKLRNLGNYNPDFIVGFGNEFTYKNVSLNLLWDWRQGGIFVSRTFSLGSTSGVLESTIPGRETGIVGNGITNTGTAGSPKYDPNTTSISAADYYGQYYNRANEANAVFNASYVKLRQASISYSLPRALTQRLKVNGIKLGFIVNNALLFTENPNVDPELNAVQGRNIVYGVEDMSLPSSRSFGFNLQVKF